MKIKITYFEFVNQFHGGMDYYARTVVDDNDFSSGPHDNRRAARRHVIEMARNYIKTQKEPSTEEVEI